MPRRIFKNAQAATDFVSTSIKTMGTKRKIKKRKAQVASIQAGKSNLGSVMRGGQKGGRSMRAANSLAGDSANFNPGAKKRKR